MLYAISKGRIEIKYSTMKLYEIRRLLVLDARRQLPASLPIAKSGLTI